MFPQIIVGFAEMLVTEEAVIGREGRGMCGSQYQMLVAVDKSTFALRVCSPKDEYKVLFPFGKGADGGIGKCFPATVLVRACLVGTYGKRSVEQQHTLLCPAGKVAGSGSIGTDIILYF